MKPVAWYDPSNGAVSTDKNSPLFTPVGQVWPLFSQRPWVGARTEDLYTMSLLQDDPLEKARQAELKACCDLLEGMHAATDGNHNYYLHAANELRKLRSIK